VGYSVEWIVHVSKRHGIRHRGSVLLASAAIAMLSLMLPLALLQVYDRIIPNDSRDTALLLGSAVAIAIFAELLLRVARSVILARAGQTFEEKTGKTLFGRILGADPRSLKSTGTGEHLDRFNAVNAVREFESGQPMVLIFDVFFAVVFLIFIAILGGWVVVWPVSAVVLAVVVVLACTPTLRKRLNSQIDTDAAVNDFLISVLGAGHNIRALAMETAMTDRYESLQVERIRAQAKSEKMGTHLGDFVGLLGQACTVCVVCHGAMLVNLTELTTGALAACTILAGRSLQPLRAAVGMWTKYVSVATTRTRMNELMHVPQADRGLAALEPSTVRGHLVLRDVRLKSSDNDAELLPPINLDIPAGQIVALIGPNASGKSTVLQLMSGELSPDTGEVSIDGTSVGSITSTSRRRTVVRLDQADALFKGSFVENLTGFRPHLRDAAIRAAQFLGFSDEIDLLPKGFDTPVTDVANTFSRGFVQRMCLARSLLDQPGVILADQSFSAMDADGKSAVKRLLNQLRGHTTVVFVTYDPELLAEADQVVDLWHGEVNSDEDASLRRTA